MTNNERPARVRAVRCDHGASDERVYEALAHALDPLDAAWERLAAARRIGIKFNQDMPPDKVVVHRGHRQQLVSDSVVRATIRLLRERTDAELFVVDIGVENVRPGQTRRENATILPLLDELDVRFIDATDGPVAWTPVPDGGNLFGSYPLPAASMEADEFVSVQTAKNHRFMGVTLTTKNLFGLAALPPEGRPRAYYHHVVRLPYVLADLARIYDPTLNIVDAMVGQAGEEWGPGDYPRVCDALVAGDQTIATDACVAHLMGHDPTSDWPAQPFIRDRNHLLVAAQGGFGTVDLDEIEFESEVDAPMGEFFTLEFDPEERVRSWIRSMCEQALFYRDNRDRLVSEHAGSYILLQMGEVRWSDPHGHIGHSRRKLAGDHPEEGLWLKYVDPDEAEAERYEVYADTLARLAGS